VHLNVLTVVTYARTTPVHRATAELCAAMTLPADSYVLCGVAGECVVPLCPKYLFEQLPRALLVTMRLSHISLVLGVPPPGVLPHSLMLDELPSRNRRASAGFEDAGSDRERDSDNEGVAAGNSGRRSPSPGMRRSSMDHGDIEVCVRVCALRDDVHVTCARVCACVCLCSLARAPSGLHPLPHSSYRCCARLTH
jgi:hypothetical protein